MQGNDLDTPTVTVWGCGLAVEVGAGRGVGDEETGDFEAWEKMSGGMTKEISKEWYHGQKWEGVVGGSEMNGGGRIRMWKANWINSSREVIYRR